VPVHTGFGAVVSRSLTALGGFVEVLLVREGHDGLVGINVLTKVQTHTLATLHGVMMVVVNDVLMGGDAGCSSKFLFHMVLGDSEDTVLHGIPGL
jgi:hypothetical protein